MPAVYRLLQTVGYVWDVLSKETANTPKALLVYYIIINSVFKGMSGWMPGCKSLNKQQENGPKKTTSII